MIKPIETFYQGYKFRSRIEARYAVFFDALGIKWVYEKEGYVLPDGTCYLPDFWLPEFNGGMWAEVKASKFSDAEKEKCWQLCKGTKHSVWLANDEPNVRVYEVYYWENGSVYSGDGIPFMDRAETGNRMFASSAYGEIGELINPEYEHAVNEKLRSAILAAKQARFEHGEKP